MKNSFVLSMAAVLIVGMTPMSMAAKPLWLKGNDPKYPKQIYVTGVGIGSDLDGARSSARAEISKVFQSKITQTATDKQTESSSALGKKRGPAESTQENETLTNVSTEGLLQGVDIAESWYDKKSKRYYALAILNRTKAKAGLSAEIVEKEESIQSLQRQLPQAKSPLEQAKLLAKALKLSREKANLTARRRVVDPSDVPDIGSDNQNAKLQAQLDECLGKIEFLLETDAEDADGYLRTVVAGKIAEQGFKVVPSAEEASPGSLLLKVKCSLKVGPFDRGHPSWKFYNWNGMVDLSDEGGKTLASSAPSGQEGHLQDETAKAKARSSGAEAVGKEVQSKISRYIFGD